MHIFGQKTACYTVCDGSSRHSREPGSLFNEALLELCHFLGEILMITRLSTSLGLYERPVGFVVKASFMHNLDEADLMMDGSRNQFMTRLT